MFNLKLFFTGMFLSLLIVSTANLAAQIPPFALNTACENRNNDTIDKFLQCITLDNLVGHLEAFTLHAENNPPYYNRASGTPGYDASVDYVVEALEKAGYVVEKQTFDFLFWIETAQLEMSRSAPDERIYITTINNDTLDPNVDAATMHLSPPGNVTAEVEAPAGLITGCLPSDFTGFTPGNIALIQRGVCVFRQKAQAAEAAGASGVIIFNNAPGLLLASLTPAHAGGIPVVGTTPEVGQELLGLANPVVSINVQTEREVRETANIIAETAGGDPNKVIVFGTDLEGTTVIGDAGINANGTGAAATLEAALKLRKLNPVNKIRFVWWGASTIGRLGSSHYVSNLSSEDRDKVYVYLNAIILGATNGIRLIMEPAIGLGFGLEEEASLKAFNLYKDYFDAKGLPMVTSPAVVGFNFGPIVGGTDTQIFYQNGMGASIINTGYSLVKDQTLVDLFGGFVGQVTFPCFHQACDNLENVNLPLFEEMSKAYAYVLFQMAMEGEEN